MDVTSGSGGLGAISVGISETVILLVVVLLVGFGIWKLVKVFWAALG